MRLLKQFFFALVWLAVLGGIGYLGYKLVFPPPPPPSCGDNCLPSDLKPISVRGDIYTFLVGTSSVPNHISVLVQLQNLNIDYAAKSFDYTFKVPGVSEAITDNSFIYAGELKYLAFYNLAVDETDGGGTPDFQIDNVSWVKDPDFSKPPTFIQNQNTTIYPDRIEVVGKFTNGDSAPLEKATVIAILFNNAGNRSGVSQTEADNIASGESRAFTIVYPYLPQVNISATQVFVYPHR